MITNIWNVGKEVENYIKLLIFRLDNFSLIWFGQVRLLNVVVVDKELQLLNILDRKQETKTRQRYFSMAIQ